jgi:hypothetical protein
VLAKDVIFGECAKFLLKNVGISGGLGHSPCNSVVCSVQVGVDNSDVALA